MTMLFSQRERFVRDEATISGMKEGQSFGQACLRIYLLSMLVERLERGAHLDEDEIELVEVPLFPPHSGLIRRNLNGDLDDKVSNTRLLVGRQGLPSCLHELLEDLKGNVLLGSVGRHRGKGETPRQLTLVLRFWEVSRIAGTRCHASGFS
jgi:hypothetical protein